MCGCAVIRSLKDCLCSTFKGKPKSPTRSKGPRTEEVAKSPGNNRTQAQRSPGESKRQEGKLPDEKNPQASNLQEDMPQEGQFQGSSSPQETILQETSPEETSPEEISPEESSPEEISPQDNNFQERSKPQGASNPTNEDEPQENKGEPQEENKDEPQEVNKGEPQEETQETQDTLPVLRVEWSIHSDDSFFDEYNHPPDDSESEDDTEYEEDHELREDCSVFDPAVAHSGEPASSSKVLAMLATRDKLLQADPVALGETIAVFGEYLTMPDDDDGSLDDSCRRRRRAWGLNALAYCLMKQYMAQGSGEVLQKAIQANDAARQSIRAADREGTPVWIDTLHLSGKLHYLVYRQSGDADGLERSVGF